MSTFKWDNVEVFPVTFNTDNSNLLSETNISEMLAALSEKRNFVVSYDDNRKKIEFYLEGYHCKIDSVGTALSTENADSLWIRLNKANGLVKQPNGNNEFEGLDYVTSEPTENRNQYFQLLVKENSTWKVPVDSYIRFTSQSIDMSSLNIDGGEI